MGQKPGKHGGEIFYSSVSSDVTVSDILAFQGMLTKGKFCINIKYTVPHPTCSWVLLKYLLISLPNSWAGNSLIFNTRFDLERTM